MNKGESISTSSPQNPEFPAFLTEIATRKPSLCHVKMRPGDWGPGGLEARRFGPVCVFWPNKRFLLWDL